jgi:hypothetical protein
MMNRGNSLVFLMLFALTASALGAREAKKMVLISNQENTQFQYRRFGDTEWKQAGPGKIETVEVQSSQRYELKAKAPGYVEKSLTIPEPMREVQFIFMVGDKEPEAAPPQAPPTPVPAATAMERPAATAATAPPPLGHGWAVVIGIADYQFAEQGGPPRLVFADKDAVEFSKALTTMGWKPEQMKVLIGTNATKRNIEYALETWLRRTSKDDLIVLYWSGHGWPDPENEERAFFGCYDSKISDASSSMRMDRVRQLLEERNTRNVLVIADTCHSGKIVRGDNKGISVKPALEAMSRRNDLPKGWVFVASADPTRVAYEDKAWNNGALTHFLLEGLRGAADGYKSAGIKDGRITVGELKEYITDRMAKEGHDVIGARLEPLFYTTSGNPEIWNLSLNEQP